MAKAPRGIEIGPKLSRDDTRVLSEDALDFLTVLSRAAGRSEHRAEEVAVFRPETSAIRDGAWKIAPLPRDLADLRTGIVTALSRKELMTALNSGARLCLADFCDFTPPSWDNLMDGQRNLMDRWTSAMDFTDPVTGKRMSLSQRLATLMVRPRPLQIGRDAGEGRRTADRRRAFRCGTLSLSQCEGVARQGIRSLSLPHRRRPRRPMPASGTTCSSMRKACSGSRLDRSG